MSCRFGWIFTALICVALVACSGSDGKSTGNTTTTKVSITTTTLNGTPTGITDLTPGECFDQVPAATQQPYAVLLIPCKEPHIYEVYASIKYDKGAGTTAEYPGALVVANNSEDQCYKLFTDFMGIQWEASDYDIQAWWPSKSSWNATRDRTIVCAVYRVTGGVTKGSVKGTEK